MRLSGRVAFIGPPHSTRTTIVRRRPSGSGKVANPGHWRLGGHSKLLNMRDFRAASGFPLEAKTRYNSIVADRRALAFPHSTRLAFYATGPPLSRPSFLP